MTLSFFSSAPPPPPQRRNFPSIHGLRSVAHQTDLTMKYWDDAMVKRNRGVDLIRYVPNATEPEGVRVIYSIDLDALLPVGFYAFQRACQGGKCPFL